MAGRLRELVTRDQTAALSEVTVEDFLDRRGDDARVNGDRLIELDRNRAIIERPTGARQTFRRRPVAVGEIVLAWEMVP